MHDARSGQGRGEFRKSRFRFVIFPFSSAPCLQTDPRTPAASSERRHGSSPRRPQASRLPAWNRRTTARRSGTYATSRHEPSGWRADLRVRASLPTPNYGLRRWLRIAVGDGNPSLATAASSFVPPVSNSPITGATSSRGTHRDVDWIHAREDISRSISAMSASIVARDDVNSSVDDAWRTSRVTYSSRQAGERLSCFAVGNRRFSPGWVTRLMANRMSK